MEGRRGRGREREGEEEEGKGGGGRGDYLLNILIAFPGLAMMHINLQDGTTRYEGGLPLSANATLTWVGFAGDVSSLSPFLPFSLSPSLPSPSSLSPLSLPPSLFFFYFQRLYAQLTAVGSCAG